MPIYERFCPLCGGHEEIILGVNERASEIICEKCHIVMAPILSVPAKTASLWNGSWNAGLSGQGFYSTALGKKVHSRREEDNIMKAKGFVSESDMGRGYIDSHIDKVAEATLAQDKINSTYIDNLNKYGGDKIKAVTETFPAHEMLKQ